MDKNEHDARNAAQADQDAAYLADLDADFEYFGSMDPDAIDNWDDSLENPLNSGNPKTATSAFEQAEIERRAVLDFEQERERLDQGAGKQE